MRDGIIRLSRMQTDSVQNRFRHGARIVGIVFLLLTAGCTLMKPPAPAAPAPTATPQPAAGATATTATPAPTATTAPTAPTATPATPVPTATPATPERPPAQTAPTAPAQGGIVSVAPVPPPAAAPKAPSPAQSAAASREQSAKAAAKAPPSPATSGQAPKVESAAPDAAKPKAPPLDLAVLEQRLKATSAIGVLTKITLKNQIDDLLDQFRSFYQGKLKTTLAELRRSYDLLVLKVISLLQDSDPALASAIVASREAIWGILSDPAKFATI